jgi:hypothetical protein
MGIIPIRGRRSRQPAISLALLASIPFCVTRSAHAEETEREPCPRPTWTEDRVEVTGSCYFSPEWVPGISLQLNGTVRGQLGSEAIHLVEGEVTAFNFAHREGLEIVVEKGPYRVAAYPDDSAKVDFETGDDVVLFSAEGDTMLQVSYEVEPRLLAEGEGLIVGFEPDQQVAPGSCSATSSTLVKLSAPFRRIRPPSFGGWIMYLGLAAGMVLLVERRRFRRRPKRNRDQVGPVREG